MRGGPLAAGACAALAAGAVAGVLTGTAGAGSLAPRSAPAHCRPAAACVLRAGPWRRGRGRATGLGAGRPAPPATTGPAIAPVPATASAPTTVTPTGPAAATTTATTPVPAPAFTRTGVALTEFAVKLAHPLLAAGPVQLNAINAGMDDHDLTVADGGGEVLGQTPVVPPGGESALLLDLAPGTYRVFCSLYDGAHDAAGMHATLTVG